MNTLAQNGQLLQPILLSCMVLAALVPVFVSAATTVTNTVTASSQSGGESNASIDVVSTVNGNTVTDVHLEETSHDGSSVELKYEDGNTFNTEGEFSHENEASSTGTELTKVETSASVQTDSTQNHSILSTLSELLKRMLSYVSLL